MKKSPIVLFVYNRLDHVKKTINSLKRNKDSKYSELIIFSDGSKNNDDEKKIIRVRKYLKKIKGFKKIKIFYQKKNLGLANSIIKGLNTIFKRFSSAIILEDDLIVSKNFLKYMNEGLNLYGKNNNVISIHAYSYPFKKDKNDPNYFFLKGADCWGWGTWSKSWKLFEKNGNILKKKLINKNLINEFNFNNSFDYMRMLKDQVKGKNNSWAIRWYASAFLKNKLTLYPKNSFVKNIGIDGSGTHGSSFNEKYNIKSFNLNYVSIEKAKISVKENFHIRKKFEDYFNSNKKKIDLKYLKKKLNEFLKKN